MIVEWDENKNELNKNKHGISFETAALIICDEDRIELFDKEHSINEDRYITIGIVGRIIVVVYTVRDNCIRIISARIATKKEGSIYYGKKMIISDNQKPTKAQLEEIEKAAQKPISFDEDSPEITDEMYEEFKRVADIKRKERQKQILTLRVSKVTM